MYNEVIKLIAEEESIDEYGDTVVVPSERIVFAQLKSIGQSEFYQAQAVGIKPEIKFVISDYLDYQNEEILKYADIKGVENEYRIIRTYRQNNTLELICKRGVD